MIKDASQNNCTFPLVKKGKLDLLVLRYMAQRVHITLGLLDQPDNLSRPLLYYSEERRRRTHRLAIYHPQELVLTNCIAFVGFVSGKRKPGGPSILNEIHNVDQKLIAELVSIPDVLSYSSLQLRDGNWCNLVLLRNAEAKIHVSKTKTHAYAAYTLAPHYYDWVRLHYGVMPLGLGRNDMILQKTRYYIYSETQLRPTVYEMISAPIHLASSYPSGQRRCALTESPRLCAAAQSDRTIGNETTSLPLRGQARCKEYEA